MSSGTSSEHWERKLPKAKAKPAVTEPAVATTVKSTTSKAKKPSAATKTTKRAPKAAPAATDGQKRGRGRPKTHAEGDPNALAGEWIHRTCTKAELSILLGISTRALSDLDARGVLVRAAKLGTFQTLPSIHAYINRLVAMASGRSGEAQTPAQKERTRREQVERELAELKLAEMKGEVIPLHEIEESWSEFAIKVKSSFMGLASKIRTIAPHLTPHDAEAIKDLCRDELAELAEEVRASVPTGDANELTR